MVPLPGKLLPRMIPEPRLDRLMLKRWECWSSEVTRLMVTFSESISMGDRACMNEKVTEGESASSCDSQARK